MLGRRKDTDADATDDFLESLPDRSLPLPGDRPWSLCSAGLVTPGGLTTVDAPLLEEAVEEDRLNPLWPWGESGTAPVPVVSWSPRWAGK